MKPLIKTRWLLFTIVILFAGIICFAKYRIACLNNADIGSINSMPQLEMWCSEVRLYRMLHILNDYSYQKNSRLLLEQEALILEKQRNIEKAIQTLDVILKSDVGGDETPFILKYRIQVKNHKYDESAICASAYRSMLVSTSEKDYAAAGGACAVTYALEAYSYRMSEEFSNALESLILGKAEIDKLNQGVSNDYILHGIQRASEMLVAEAYLLYPKLLDPKDKMRAQSLIKALRPFCPDVRGSYFSASEAIYKFACGDVAQIGGLPSNQEVAESAYCKLYGFEPPKIPIQSQQSK